VLTLTLTASAQASPDGDLDARLKQALTNIGFTGRVGSTLEKRLGRPVNADLAKLGNDLFFDKILSLANDNSCAGCHAPQNAFGDSQSIAIGVAANNTVGPSRKGPRNQRRTPSIINTAFYPKLMWNGRFAAVSGDPFNSADGFEFPPPEGLGSPSDRTFPPGDEHLYHLLVPQAIIPSTELPEMAGFRMEGPDRAFRESRFGGQLFLLRSASELATRKSGGNVVEPDVLPHGVGGFFNEPIRGRVLLRVNDNPEYKKRFAALFPEVNGGQFITFEMIGQAIAEFEISMTFVDAPLDRFAQGDSGAMTAGQKRGALTFFGKARCAECHSVSGASNEMFSDFEMHTIAVPQIAPKDPGFGNATGNVPFKGPGNNEDFGLEDITLRETDRYRFRTSPLRNLKPQPTFGHNGAWTTLADAIRHHLDPARFARAYNPKNAGVAPDLWTVGPIEPVISRLSPRLSPPITLTDVEFKDLVEFVSDGLLDARAMPAEACKKVPASVPSGRTVQVFEGCKP